VSPQRIQRKRTKGWRMPEGAVYVGRPTRWGNPFVVAPDDGAFIAGAAAVLGLQDWQEAAVLLHRAWMRGASYTEPLHPWGRRIGFTEGSIGGMAWIEGSDITGAVDLPKVPDLVPLLGRDLACWCDLAAPCHADVLLELANR